MNEKLDKPFNPTKVQRDLLDEYIEGTLPEAKFSELASMLQNSPEMRRLYRRLIDVENELFNIAEPEVTRLSLADTNESKSAKEAQSRRLSLGHWLSYAAVAAITAIVTYVAADLSLKRPAPASIMEASLLPAVATVSLSQDKLFADEQRISPGPIATQSGELLLVFDNGVILSLKPHTQIMIYSDQSIRLLNGNLVFENRISDLNFDVNTPAAQLLNYGARYELIVTETNEEIHVYEGELLRIPDSGAEMQLNAEEAWRFTRGLSGKAEKIALLSQTSQMTAPNSHSAIKHSKAQPQHLSYDPIQYPDGVTTDRALLNSGEGWQEPWQWSRRDAADNLTEFPPLSIRNGTPVLNKSHFLNRKLSSSLRFDHDATYWFTYQFQFEPFENTRASIYLNLRTSNGDSIHPHDHRRILNIINLDKSVLIARFGRSNKTKLTRLKPRKWYQLFGRIKTSKLGPDRMDTAILPYVQRQSIMPDEIPWLSSVFYSANHGIVDTFAFHVESETDITVRDARLSSRFEDVFANTLK